MQRNTQVATIDEASTPALYFGDQLARLNEVMRVNQGADATFDIKDIAKVPFPGAGAGTWGIPGVDGHTQHVAEIEGVILAWQTHRGHFKGAYTGGNEAPDCFAEEPIPGEAWQGSIPFNGAFGGACKTCPIGQWKIDGGNKIAPLCKPRIRVYIQVRGIALPIWIDLPSTSVPVFKEYMKALTQFGFTHYQVVTIFGLEPAESKPKGNAKKGIAYSLLKIRVMRDPDDEREKKRVYLFSPLETTQIVERRNMILAMIDPAMRAARRAAAIDAEDAASGEAEPDADTAAAAFGIDGDL